MNRKQNWKGKIFSLGERLFRERELREAYLKAKGTHISLNGIASHIAYFIFRFLSQFLDIEKLKLHYIKRNYFSHNEHVPTFDKKSIIFGLNNIYNLPDVEVCMDRPKTFNVLVPAFDFGSMSAGFFGVFQTALYIKKCGINVRLVLFDDFHFNYREFKERLQGYPGMENLCQEIEVEYVGSRKTPLLVSPHDNCLATVWYSAYFAQKIMSKLAGSKFLYLIQDYEAYFYPGSSLFSLAEKTYSMDFNAIFSTKTLKDFFIKNNIGNINNRGVECEYFNNACSSSLSPYDKFIKDNKCKEKRFFAFYSRPSVNRNMFELGALSLIEAYQRGAFSLGDWEFFGIGIGKCKIELAKGVYLQQMERMNLKQYQDKISTFDIGLSLMASPHPSLLPFDLAGSGALVVTNSFATKSPDFFSEISGNIICKEPCLEDVVEGIFDAVKKIGNLDDRFFNAKNMKYPTCWDESWEKRHANLIIKTFNNGGSPCVEQQL